MSVSVSDGCIIAMGPQKGFIDGGQGRWLETDPESDGSEWDFATKDLVLEWCAGWSPISRVTGWSGKMTRE